MLTGKIVSAQCLGVGAHLAGAQVCENVFMKSSRWLSPLARVGGAGLTSTGRCSQVPHWIFCRSSGPKIQAAAPDCTATYVPSSLVMLEQPSQCQTGKRQSQQGVWLRGEAAPSVNLAWIECLLLSNVPLCLGFLSCKMGMIIIIPG